MMSNAENFLKFPKFTGVKHNISGVTMVKACATGGNRLISNRKLLDLLLQLRSLERAFGEKKKNLHFHILKMVHVKLHFFDHRLLNSCNEDVQL